MTLKIDMNTPPPGGYVRVMPVPVQYWWNDGHWLHRSVNLHHWDQVISVIVKSGFPVYIRMSDGSLVIVRRKK